MFKDRADAGRQLAERLQEYAGRDAVVLALPRGGVVPASIIAQTLHVPLDIIAIRKIGHPRSPEFAIGAVDENGMLLVERSETSEVDEKWLHEEIGRQKLEARRRSDAYRRGEQPLELAGKVAIIVDDGIATGLSMRLAVGSLHVRKPQRIIVAVPVAPAEAIEKLREEGADQIVVLEPPERFKGSIGEHYTRFDQLDDEEVIKCVQDAHGV